MAQESNTAPVKKVGQPAPAKDLPAGQKPAKQKREKKVRPSLPPEVAVGADGKSVLNTEGKFTGVPVKWTKANKALREKDFVDESTFMEFKAWLVEQGIQKEMNRVKALREEAADIRKQGGNPKVRKTVRKVKKMRESLKEMLEALKAEGIEL